MPSIVTHHLFAKDVFESIPKSIQEKIDFPHFLLFAQSFDNLFYYKFLTPWIGKEIRNFGLTGQKEKVNLYFKNILLEIEKNHYENRHDILGYLYGSLCHYVLDYHCHPFIFYHTGDSQLNRKYHGLHEKMEVNLDACLYKRKTSKDLYKQKLANELLPKLKFSDELKHTMNLVFGSTFNKYNIGSIYESSVKTGNFLLKYGVTDRTGLKKELYKLKDFLTPYSSRKYQYLSFYVKEFYKEYLNEEHETWYNPVDKNMTSNKSFFDLYEDSKEEIIRIIKAIDTYFKTKKDFQKIINLIGNRSYTTGLDCDKPYVLKYFKDL